MKVHQCNDEQNVPSDLIDDSVGEPIRSAAAGFSWRGASRLRGIEGFFGEFVLLHRRIANRDRVLANRNSRWPQLVRTGQAAET